MNTALNLFNICKEPPIALEEVFEAYFQCRKNKRRTCNAIGFETDFEDKLIRLWEDIVDGTYYPGRSIAFVVTKPVKREVFAADFRDRIVHHLIAAKIMDLLEAEFINDSYSCRVGKGTQYGIKRVAEFIRNCSQDYTQDCYILKMDIKSFFMSMDKPLLYKQLIAFLEEKYQGRDKNLLFELIRKVIFNAPEDNCCVKGVRSDWKGLPPSKSLFTVPKNKGLPIGNLTSQLFANFYLNGFDHFVKNDCHMEFYGRYVDDFVIVHQDKQVLLDLIPKLREFLKQKLMLTLHPNKIYLQHFSKGVKFVGAVIKPGREYIANRTKGNFFEAIRNFNQAADEDDNYIRENAEHFVSSINSYLGFMKHYSTYKIRRKMIVENISDKWKKVITFDDRMNKISLCREVKPDYVQKLKLRRQRINRRRNRKKQMPVAKVSVRQAVIKNLNPFV